MSPEQLIELQKTVAETPQGKEGWVCVGSGDNRNELTQKFGIDFKDLYMDYHGEIIPNNYGNCPENLYYVRLGYFQQMEKPLLAGPEQYKAQ